MEKSDKTCELCASAGGTLLWQSPLCRVVRVAEPNYPGFCRVILNGHMREMSELDAAQRQALMNVVFSVEAVILALFKPHKINLASFGNMVPHVHWHVIPRWLDDRHFPEPIWGAVQREGRPDVPAIDDATLSRALVQQLGVTNRDGIEYGH